MIPYAGYDPTEDAPASDKALLAYEMFSSLGLDTRQIAHRMGISEAKALKHVNQVRSAVVHKQNPYGQRGVS